MDVNTLNGRFSELKYPKDIISTNIATFVSSVQCDQHLTQADAGVKKTVRIVLPLKTRDLLMLFVSN